MLCIYLMLFLHSSLIYVCIVLLHVCWDDSVPSVSEGNAVLVSLLHLRNSLLLINILDTKYMINREYDAVYKAAKMSSTLPRCEVNLSHLC